jgi:photosystem II stability/assembly factor-like uncharacterized protein
VYASGGDMLLHYDGITWTRLISKDENPALNEIQLFPDNRAVVVGDAGHVHFYDSSSWTQVDCGTNRDLQGVWGYSYNDIFAVGILGTIRHFNGSTWTRMTGCSGYQLNDIYGFTPDDVFIAGNSGIICHYDGISWTRMISCTSENLLGIWGISGSDIFIVGAHGTICRFDGINWIPVTAITSNDIYALWGISYDNIFAAGDHGTVLHFDGSMWSQVVDPVFAGHNFREITGNSAGEIYLMGARDPQTRSIQLCNGNLWNIEKFTALIHYNGITWESVTEFPSQRDFYGVACNSFEIFGVGEQSSILHFHNPPVTFGSTLTVLILAFFTCLPLVSKIL